MEREFLMRRTAVMTGIAALVAAGAVAAWRGLAVPKVELVQPTRGPAVEAVYATGTVEPSLEIRISPRTAGRIIELNADEGDVVKRGAVLARLEDADMQS